MRTALKTLANQTLATIPPWRQLYKRIRKLEAQLAQTDTLRAQIDTLRHEVAEKTDLLGGELPPVPNGHFYSPVHSRGELAKDISRVYPDQPTAPLDIDLNEAGQLELLKIFKQYLIDLPFEAERGNFRYGYRNTMYSLGDASALIAMLRYLRPERFVEVGSGHSSAVALDIDELYLNNSIQFTFIEPYPERLLSLLKPKDLERTTIHEKRVQDVDLSVFTSLGAGDILFIDSTHVSKIGSDVNHLFFEILPILAKGVYIHIHDVFYPFEYPKVWTLERGIAWNELYLLRALLQNSKAYEIVHYSGYLAKHHSDALRTNAPQVLEFPGGNIWLRKVE